jgi:hypothetical protein
MTGLTPYGPALTAALDAAGVPSVVSARLARHGFTRDFIASVVLTPGLRSPEDADALILLSRSGLDEDEMLAWARAGSLEAAFRLFSSGVSLASVRAFPLRQAPLKNLIRLHQVARDHGVLPDAILDWVTGGVMSVNPPHIDEDAYAMWRQTGVHHLGMRRAALACAAGLTPSEAVALADAGTIDDAALRLLAGLRVSEA